jgi:hypothetical protein
VKCIEAMRPINEPVASVTYTSLYFSEIFILRIYKELEIKNKKNLRTRRRE